MASSFPLEGFVFSVSVGMLQIGVSLCPRDHLEFCLSFCRSQSSCWAVLYMISEEQVRLSPFSSLRARPWRKLGLCWLSWQGYVPLWNHHSQVVLCLLHNPFQILLCKVFCTRSERFGLFPINIIRSPRDRCSPLPLIVQLREKGR